MGPGRVSGSLSDLRYSRARGYLRAVVDDVVAAELAERRRLRRRRRRADDGAARQLGKLHGEVARAARRRRDQHRLSRLQPAGLLQHRARRKGADPQPDHLRPGVWHHPQAIRLDLAELRKGGANEADGVAHGHVAHAIAYGRHDSDALGAQRKVGRLLVAGEGMLASSPKRLAATIHSGIRHMHQHLVLAHRWQRPLHHGGHRAEAASGATCDQSVVSGGQAVGHERGGEQRQRGEHPRLPRKLRERSGRSARRDARTGGGMT